MDMNNFRRSSAIPDDLTKGAGVIPVASDTGRILLSLRGPHQESPYTWASWGGYSLIGEPPGTNASREFFEETLYQGNITLFPCHVYSDVVSEFRFETFIGVIPNEFKPTLDNETADFKWVTISQLYGEGMDLHPKFKNSLIDAKPILMTILLSFKHLNEGRVKKFI